MAAGPERAGESAAVSVGAFRALTIVATGGPLALVALYAPGIVGDNPHLVLLGVLAIAAFLPALLVWLGYSRQVVGSGGLYAFVEVAAGRRIARVQAGLWITSYFLYLIYTTTFVAYDVLAPVLSWAVGIRGLLQVLTALVVAAICLLPLRSALHLMSLLALIELVLMGAVLAAELRLPAVRSIAHPTVGSSAVAAANLSLLFICAGLPLFLGGEVRGGSKSVRNGILSGWLIAAIAMALVLIPMVRISDGVRSAAVPGAVLARSVGWPLVADALGIGLALAVVGVMVAEFLALSRLLHALSGLTLKRVSMGLAVALIVGTLLALVQPERIYEDLLKPSLVTLWLSQLFVFAWYPRYVRRVGGRLPWAVLLGVGGTALMAFGLWSTIANQLLS